MTLKEVYEEKPLYLGLKFGEQKGTILLKMFPKGVKIQKRKSLMQDTHKINIC